MFSSSSPKRRHYASASMSSSCSPRRSTVMMSLYLLMISSIVSLILIFQSQSVTTRATMTEASQRFATTTSASTTINNRNFMSHPVTAEESNRLFRAMQVKHRQKHQQQGASLDVTRSESDSGLPSPFLRVAVCHPTIFIPQKLDNATIKNENSQDTMLQRFLAFASYYRLLGFEHLFFWYESPVARLPYFDQLAALPYVTLTEYRGRNRKGGDDYHGQGTVEALCLQDERFARLYDWVLNVDADEYLWLAPPTTAALNTTNDTVTSPATRGRHRLTIQDFLEPYHAQNYNYISIGKLLYSTKHVDIDYYNDKGGDSGNSTTTSSTNDKSKQSKKNNPFGLLQYPYTPGPYCYKTKRRTSGNPICPNWMGRSKILVQPEYHSSVHVHGTNHGLLNKETGIHLHALQQGHLKEWIWIHEPPQPSIIHFDNASFQVTHNDQLQTYYVMESSRRDEQDKVEVYHDGRELREWFDFLSQQLLTLPKGNNYDDDKDDNRIMNIVHKLDNRGDYHHSKKHNDTKTTSNNNNNKKTLKRASRMNPSPTAMNNNRNNELLEYSLSPAMKKNFLRLNQQLQEGRSAHKLQKLQSLLQQKQ